MSVRASLHVTSGPDRGRRFELADELVHLGRGDDNQIVLTDPALAEYLLSFVNRNGRFALYTPLTEGIEIDGTAVPAERWVWLPTTAVIQLSRRTAVEFQSQPGAGQVERNNGDDDATARELATPRPAQKAKKSKKPVTPPGDATLPPESAGSATPSRRGATVARFITDGPGDPLVKLGENGTLPELTLATGTATAAPRLQPANPRTGPPWGLIAAFAVSLGMSLAMLFVDAETFSGSAGEKARARRDIVAYYGDDKSPLQPYQLHLRAARQAYSRGDIVTERAEYRQVLRLLRAEGKSRFQGLTGNPDSDAELERLIARLMTP